MTIVYKICHEKDGKYFSFNFFPFTDPGRAGTRLEYRIGKTRHPSKRIPNSKLFAFSTLAHALKFRSDYCTVYYLVFKAEATNVIPGCVICNQFSDVMCKRFWEEMESNEYTVGTQEAPLGTVYCDTIKLLEKVI